jgi:hypothetical protein
VNQVNPRTQRKNQNKIIYEKIVWNEKYSVKPISFPPFSQKSQLIKISKLLILRMSGGGVWE